MPRFAALLLLLLLAACGPAMVEADVTRFTTLPADGGARSFTIVPDPGQAGSLEFQHYAEMVAAQLGQRRWQPLPAGNDAAAVVLLHWGSGPPATEVWSDPSWGWGGWGPGGRFPDAYPPVSVSTVWPKWLAVEVVDGPDWRAGTKRVIWQGRATTSGSRPAIAPVMSGLVRALFKDFPGRNGETVRVEVPQGT